MKDLFVKYLIDNGFEIKKHIRYLGQGVKEEVDDPSENYINTAFEPTPTVNPNSGVASIGSLHFKAKSQEDLEKFVTKVIPTFCDFL